MRMLRVFVYIGTLQKNLHSIRRTMILFFLDQPEENADISFSIVKNGNWDANTQTDWTKHKNSNDDLLEQRHNERN